MTNDLDLELQLQAVKTIANFAVDFKSFLAIEGLVAKLLMIIQTPMESERFGLKACSVFALKNLSFSCN